MVGKNNAELVSVKIEIELETLDNIKKLFGTIDNGCTVQIYDGEAELKLLTAGNSLSFDGGLTAEILLSFSIGVASGVVGNFIFAALCKGAKKLTLNNRRTRITEETITQVIETTKVTVVKKSHDLK